MITEKYTIIDEEVSVKIAGSELESVRAKRIKRNGVRVYREGCIGVSGYMGEEGEPGALKRAEDALAYRIPYPVQPEKDFKKDVPAATKAFTAGELDAEAAAVLDAVKKDFPQFVYSSPGFKSGVSTFALTNDAGLELRHAIPGHGFGMVYKLASSPSIMDGWFDFDGVKYDRAAFLAYASQILAAHLNEVPLPAEGKLPVFFPDNDGLVSGIFDRELGGMNFGSGGSLFSGKAGQKLFSEGLTAVNARERAFMPFFDAEGVRGEGFTYIENGVLKAPYCDKKTASKFAFAPSGCAAASYDSTPETGPACFSIKPQRKTVKDMLGGETAIYVAMASGGDFTSEGGFGTPVQLAFLMKDGKLVGKLPELQLSSSVYQMYGSDFLGVSSDTIMPLTENRWLGFMLDVKKG